MGKMANATDLILEPPSKQAERSLSPSRYYGDRGFQFLYEQEYAAHQKTRLKLKAAEDRIIYLEGKVEKLEGDLRYIKKLLFSGKSEKHSCSKPPPPSSDFDTPKSHGAQPGHPGHGRNIPFHLPMQDYMHRIHPDDLFCPLCGKPFKELPTEEVSYEVTVEVLFILLKHRRKKYRKTCRCHNRFLIAPGPIKLFEGGLYSMDFWIKVLLDKYAYGLPLQRQVTMMETEGLSISRGVLSSGLLRMAPYLKSLYDLMSQRIAFEKLVHGDETRWYNWASRYDLTRTGEKTRWWLWGFFSARYHIFVIDPSRGADVIKDTLGQGEAQTVVPIIVSDRFRAYPAAANTVAFCWSHVRRDFINLKIKHPTDEELCAWADTWIYLIRDLYALNYKRLRYRHDSSLFDAHQKQLEDVLDRMQALMNKPYAKEPQTKQVESMRHHWEGLTRFLDDPDIPLDNNLAERALRTPVVGRKNFYGNHSDRAAEATAIFYSIISSCKLHHIHPHKLLKRYLTACVQPRGSPMPQEILESFLPHEYAKRYPDDSVKESVSADVNQ